MTNPQLKLGVGSTPETLCEKHFRQWILSNKFMLQMTMVLPLLTGRMMLGIGMEGVDGRFFRFGEVGLLREGDWKFRLEILGRTWVVYCQMRLDRGEGGLMELILAMKFESGEAGMIDGLVGLVEDWVDQ